jgi:hypothetical protein
MALGFSLKNIVGYCKDFGPSTSRGNLTGKIHKEDDMADDDLEIKDDYYYRVSNKTDQDVYLDEAHIYHLYPKWTPPFNVRVYSGSFLNHKADKVKQLIHDGQISYESLDIKVNTPYRISNRTARRIGIENIEKLGSQPDEKWGDLVIPPFGTRIVNSEMLKWYRFVDWQRQDLIHMELEEKASKGPGSWEVFWNWLKLLPGLVLVALVGFGIPLWVVYNFGNGDQLMQSFVKREMFASGQEAVALMGLGRLFQVGFICLASILPALFYYLFGRQHVEKLRRNFFHDILILDPHIYTLSEAESKYDTLLSSAYGSSSSGSPFTILLLMFSTVILVAGWTLTLTPYGPVPNETASLVDFFAIKSSAFTLGFLGIYFFAINMVFRRYVRADLTPKTYANITVRMLVTFVLVWSIGALPEFSGSPIMQNGLLPLAFIIGVFPENGFRVIRDSARKIISGLQVGDDEKYPLTDLEGLNQYDRARLLEEGIENIENLAHHNLVELLAFTRIPTARLVDMFDQAILYLHLGIFDQDEEDGVSKQTRSDSKKEQADGEQSSTGEQNQNQESAQNGNSDSGRELLKYLKSFGVRTATDLVKLIHTIEEPEISRVINDPSRITHLRTIRTTFEDDEWLAYIMNWRKESSKEAVIKASFVNDPFKFYETDEKETPSLNTKQDENVSEPDTSSTQPTSATIPNPPNPIVPTPQNGNREAAKTP